MFKSTGSTGRFLMISAQGGRIGGAGHLRRPGNGPSLACLSMSELSSKLPGMVAEEWNQKNPFLAIKVIKCSSHVRHHIVKLKYTAYNMLITCLHYMWRVGVVAVAVACPALKLQEGDVIRQVNSIRGDSTSYGSYGSYGQWFGKHIRSCSTL